MHKPPQLEAPAPGHHAGMDECPANRRRSAAKTEGAAVADDIHHVLAEELMRHWTSPRRQRPIEFCGLPGTVSAPSADDCLPAFTALERDRGERPPKGRLSPGRRWTGVLQPT